MSPQPARLLFVRPDTYGDLILFEPVLRLVRELLPRTRLAVLIREPYADVAPLIGGEGIEWLTTACNPYKEGPRDNRAAFDALRATVCAFAPDWLVAACYERTWLEAAVATFLPESRQICLGTREFDPLTRATLDAQLTINWPALYPDKVLVDEGSRDWDKNIRLVYALTSEASARTGAIEKAPLLKRIAQDLGIHPESKSGSPRWWPQAQVPEDARGRAREIFAELGLDPSAVAI